jgi:hypothetical protein
MTRIFEAPVLTDCGDAVAQTLAAGGTHSLEGSLRKWNGAGVDTPLGMSTTTSDEPGTTTTND